MALLCIQVKWASTAAFVFLLSELVNWADGYFARKMNLISDFGKLMDALTDKVFVCWAIHHVTGQG